MQHLLLDLYECNAQKLADADELRRFLGELPAHLGMQPAGPPDLFFIDAVSNPNDAGHSGLTLACNHVSLHAWPPYRMVNIDIFAKTAFDEAEAIAYARAAFEPGDIEVHLVQRATRSPGRHESIEELVVPGGENALQSPPKVAPRCLWPGGCLNSTGSALMKYCAVHKEMIPPP